MERLKCSDVMNAGLGCCSCEQTAQLMNGEVCSTCRARLHEQPSTSSAHVPAGALRWLPQVGRHGSSAAHCAGDQCSGVGRLLFLRWRSVLRGGTTVVPALSDAV